LPTLEVAARLVEQTPGITRLMNTLAAKKYIRRRRCKDDRRQQLCSLTASGARVIDSVIPLIRATHARMLKELSGDDVARMVGLLRRVAPQPNRPST
jgi:DNA-binding MarR family transcriptional regulator